jgi:glutathione S-transferase
MSLKSGSLSVMRFHPDTENMPTQHAGASVDQGLAAPMSATPIKLLGKRTSINVRKVLWLCVELQLDVVQEDWGSGFKSTQTPAFLALNPNAMVPVLIDHDLVLWESNTICRYLAGREQRFDLLPATPAARARVEQWMDWQATDLNSAWRYPFMALVRQSPDHTDPRALGTGVAAWNRLMHMLDDQLNKSGAFVAGADFTLADVVLGVSVNRWLMTPMNKPRLHAVSAWYERLRQRPGFRTFVDNGTA